MRMRAVLDGTVVAESDDTVVVEGNQLNKASLELLHGIEHLSVRNNVITNDGGTAINLMGYSQTYHRGSSDVYITHNTVINNTQDGRFLKVGGAVDGKVLQMGKRRFARVRVI